MDGDDEISEFKVVLIGDHAVGKTSLINRFYRDIFNDAEPPTIAASYLQVPVTVNDVTIKLNIWDTAGDERFHCIVPLYARTAQVLITVFDISNTETFNNAKEWLNNLVEEIGKIPIAFMVANKMDLKPSADLSLYEKWAKSNSTHFESTSAKEGTNVKKLFMRIAEILSEMGVHPRTERKFRPNIAEQDTSDSCC